MPDDAEILPELMENEFDVAIVGMAGRFPGARNLEEFWHNLVHGVESIARLSDQEIVGAGVSPHVLTRADYVKASPVLDDPALFDAAFFGYSPGEAATVDPQQRLLLELAHAALEDAACDPDRYRGRIGVFAGAAMNTYFLNRGLEDQFAENYLPTLIANDKDFLATRISYKLGLRGPSLTVQSACSTSLVAVHLARQSLLNEETDMALAGAVSVRVPHRAGYFYDGSGVVSPDGHVRAFDAAANGTVFGSGAGVVVLKRLADARAGGDRIHAVIKGSAVNNDGSGKAGYTAPSVEGQADVVVEALANAGLSADGISFLEAHGSGTAVGDRIEILALTKAFRQFTPRNGYCAIGSVKTNVGHLDVAAGMAGLIKTVLALKHRRIPPTLHYSKFNDEIDFPATPFFVNSEALDWSITGGVRRAGVMATGIGGTNAHVILEEAPEVAPVGGSSGPHLLLLSARTPSALAAVSANLADFLASADGAGRELGAGGPPESEFLAEVARTLQTGRRFFLHRRIVVCRRRADAVAALRTPNFPPAVSGSARAETRPSAVFLLPGVGDHYVGMGQGLYEHFELFRQEVDRCAHILQPLLGLDIREIMYPRVRAEKASARPRGIDFKQMMGRTADGPADPAAQRLDRTLYAQPALFTVEYALARLWIHWGVQPVALVGHSMGEYVAACLAGVFSLPDALRLIAARAKLVNELPPGAMVAVMLPEREVLPLLGEKLSLSLINGPNLCVVAGPVAAMDDFQNRLTRREVIFRAVRNAHAFHSRLLDPIVDSFVREVGQVPLCVPRLPFISNVTGTWITADQATDPLYWAEHARSTARFGDALDALWKLADASFVEVGPGRTLGVLAMQHPTRPVAAKPLAVSSLRHDYENHPDADFILNSVGRLWLEGGEINWDHLAPWPGPRRISLPIYPFERLRHWIEPNRARPPAVGAPNGAAPKTGLADWFSVPSWTRTSFPIGEPGAPEGEGPLWLVIADSSRLASQVVGLLEQRGSVAALACFGEAYAHRREHAWEIRAGCLDDYLELLGTLRGRLSHGLNVIHLGPLSPEVRLLEGGPDPLGQELGFFSLLYLAQAIGEQAIGGPVRIGSVIHQVHEVTGEETLNPAMATVVGLCGVLPKEYPNVTSFSVDLPASPSDEPRRDEWASHLLDEFRDPGKGAVIAYRGKYRWERTFRPQRLPAIESPATGGGLHAQGLRPRGVYLITGGTGGIGLAVAKHLAEACQARLVLTKKTPFPPKAEWRERLAAGALPDSDRRIVAALLEIEALGGEVDVFSCDVSDRAGMQRVIDESLAKHRVINGAIHAAGILRDGMIQVQTREMADAILAPKVSGTSILYDLLKDLKPDLLVLFSSISSIVPTHGQSAYCAANAFLDAFASYANAQGRCRTLTINWPAWREVGILPGLKALAGLEYLKEAILRRAISTRDGLEVFKRAVGANFPQVIVSPQDLEALRSESNEPRLDIFGAAHSASGPSVTERRGIADEPRDGVEKAVAAIWSGVLGVAPIGIHENFLDLGGHSLLAMRIVAQIRAAYQVNFTLRKFFEDPTIAGTALTLQTEIVAEIEGLSDDEASRRVS